MRLLGTTAIVLSSSILSACAPEAPVHAPAPSANPLLGAWTATRVDFRGLPPEGDPGIRLAFNEESVVWMMESPSGPIVMEGAYRFDLSTTPPHVDLVDPMGGRKDRFKLGLFRIAGNELTIVVGDQRPTTFEEGVMGRLVLEREGEAGKGEAR